MIYRVTGKILIDKINRHKVAQYVANKIIVNSTKFTITNQILNTQ